ncbi:MAG: TetR/AcrR family transcriptional regulator [Ktedonobacteraceae bacterium]
MVRIVKEYAVRRSEILDVAQRLVYTEGYEQMAIQDILDDLQIAKGTFYHYFGSKQELLEALIERMLEEVEQLLTPIVHESHLPALEKFQHFFATLAHWKTERKTFFLALLRVWYKDENAIVRQKVRAAGAKQVTPLLTLIIRQGIQEGVLLTSFPDHVGEIVLSVMQGLQETLAALLLSCEPNHDTLQRIESIVAAYTDALERVLGAPTGSLCLVDAETLKEWVISTETTHK